MAIPVMERPPAQAPRREPEREGGRWLVGAGAALLVLGVAALLLAEETTLLSVMAMGIVCILAGVFQASFALTSRGWEGFGLHALLSALYVIVGVYMVRNPLGGAAVVTLGLGLLFTVSGVFRILDSGARRFHGWGWSFCSGLVTAALGLYVLAILPVASLLVLGTFLGVDLVLFGGHLMGLGAMLRSVRRVV